MTSVIVAIFVGQTNAQDFPEALIKQCEAIKDIEVIFETTSTWEKGVFNGTGDNESDIKVSSPKHQHRTQKNMFRADKNRLLLNYTRAMFNESTERFHVMKDNEVFDGRNFKSMTYEKQDDGSVLGKGYTNFGRSHTFKGYRYLFPLILSVRGNSTTGNPHGLIDYVKTEANAVFKAKKCSMYTNSKSKRKLFIDASNPMHIIGWRDAGNSLVHEGRVLNWIKSSGYTFPSHWTTTIFENGKVFSTSEYRVASLTLEPQFDQHSFEMPFPQGLTVVDKSTSEEFLVSETGQLLSNGERGKSSDGGTWVAMLACIPLIAILVWIYVKKRKSATMSRL
jgi:hypothetical protein